MQFQNFRGKQRSKEEISLIQFVDDIVTKQKQSSNTFLLEYCQRCCLKATIHVELQQK